MNDPNPIGRRHVLVIMASGVGLLGGVVAGLRWRSSGTSTGDATAAVPGDATAGTAGPTVSAAPSESSAAPTTASVSTTTEAASTTTTSSSTTTTTVAEPRVVEVIRRAGWGAALPTGPFTSHTISRVTVHHTAAILTDNRNAPRVLAGHQRFHQDSGFVDLAYHMVVDRNGNVYEARDLGIAGETFTNYDPVGHFLPVLDGNFEEQDVSEAQFDRLIDLVAWGLGEFGLDIGSIAGHRDLASTACPGAFVYSRMQDGTLQGQVSERLAAGGVRLAYLDDEASQERVAAIEAGNA
jgi:hypothetical protein